MLERGRTGAAHLFQDFCQVRSLLLRVLGDLLRVHGQALYIILAGCFR
jgi:hypothetical protein